MQDKTDPMIAQPSRSVQFALVVEPPSVAQRAVRDLQEEFAMRPYYRDPEVRWDSDHARVIIRLVTEGTWNLETEVRQLHEEVFEIATTVLGEFEKMRVEIMD